MDYVLLDQLRTIFYNALEIMLKGNVKGKVLFERLIFAPLFMVLTLYILERLKVGFSYSLYANPNLLHRMNHPN